ncbi:MAG: 2Fe-2S iron-sulfur cluster-binding protein [archaeon]|nr:2Fe-2S iron-sulfur cluster-binding protein [archaeon]
MTILTNIKDGRTREVPCNEKIIKQFEELDVIFSCQDGLCGTCRIIVTEGHEVLEEMTQEEKDFGLNNQGNDERLACQCKCIKEGNVKFKPVWG